MAQSVARMTLNHKVRGSSPLQGLFIFFALIEVMIRAKLLLLALSETLLCLIIHITEQVYQQHNSLNIYVQPSHKIFTLIIVLSDFE